MSQRFVTLGDGRKMGLGAYVCAWRAALAAPADAVFRGTPRDPRGYHGTATRADVLRDLRDGLHDRINRHIPGYGHGRKWESDWFWSAFRTARDVNTPRLIVRNVPAEFRARLAHRLTVD